MRSMKGAGRVLVGLVVLWTVSSARAGEWEDYLKSPYQDFRWNWLIRDGHLAYGQGKYKEALDNYQAAMDKGCKDPLMLFRVGYCHRALRDSEEAAKYFSASKAGLAADYPKHRYNWFSRYYLAELFFEKGLALEAEKEKATECYRKAREELEEAIARSPKFAQAFILYGNIHYQQGEHELAVEKYVRAHEINPKSAQALINLGASYAAIGKYEEALQAYTKAKALSPQDVKIFLATGGIYSEMKKPDEALKEYEGALQIQPNSEKALVGAGNAAWQTGKNKEAVEYYQKALAENLRSYEALLGLGLVMLKTNYETLLELGLVTEKKVQFEKAEAYFKECLKVKPRSREAHYNLGVLYDSQGDFDNAIKQYVQAIEIDPDDESCYYNVGLAFIKAGLYEQAKSHLNDAIERFGKESKWGKANLKLLELIDKIEKGKEAEVERELEKAREEGEPSGRP